MRRHPELDVDSLRIAAGSAWGPFAAANHRSIKAAAKGLTVVLADRWACRLGLHPAVVWPCWVELVERERRMAYNARKAAAERRRYQTDEAKRARKRAARRAYYQQCGEYEKASARRYYEANRGRILEQRRARRRAA